MRKMMWFVQTICTVFATETVLGVANLRSQPLSAILGFTPGENMTQPNQSLSKAGKQSSAPKSRPATLATPPDETLKESLLDEIAAGKLLAEPGKREPWPPCDTDA
jgi:hypothetical protein